MGLLAIFVLTAGACGGGAEPLPLETGSLAPGRYSTEEFEPALSFEVGEGWGLAAPEEPSSFGIVWRDPRAGRDPTINFLNAPSEVYSPEDPEGLAPVPAPKDWVSWFRGHPYLEAGEPHAASVGSVEGRQLVTSVDLLPGEDFDSVWCGGGRWLALWPMPEGYAWCGVEGTVDQFIVLEDVGGETVLINIGASAGKFEGFLPRAREVLETVEWEGA